MRAGGLGFAVALVALALPLVFCPPDLPETVWDESESLPFLNSGHTPIHTPQLEPNGPSTPRQRTSTSLQSARLITNIGRSNPALGGTLTIPCSPLLC